MDLSYALCRENTQGLTIHEKDYVLSPSININYILNYKILVLFLIFYKSLFKLPFVLIIFLFKYPLLLYNKCIYLKDK